MATERYERQRVPITRKTRLLHIAVSGLCIAAGAIICIPAFRNLHDPDSQPILFWGLLVAGVGLFGLLYSLGNRHQMVLTVAGLAAKAENERISTEKQAKRDAVFLGFVFWAAVLGGIVYSVDPIFDVIEGRVAVYPVYCAAKIPTGECASGGWRAGSVTKYIVHIDQQLVVALADGASEPTKLFNCVVADVKNWSCTLDPDKDSTHAVMRNGEFSYNPPTTLPSEFRYTSRWHYLVTKYWNEK